MEKEKHWKMTSLWPFVLGKWHKQVPAKSKNLTFRKSDLTLPPAELVAYL